MKILVTIKRVPDPEQKPKFKGNGLDLSGANWVINTFDEYAVETALRLVENAATGERAGQVVVVSIGPKECSQQIRTALAMGADRAILIEAADDALDADSVARVLKAVVEREKPDMLLMGKQTVDGDTNQVAQMTAALLGWPQATCAATIDLAPDSKSVTVGREVDSGVETKKAALPGVVTVDLRIVSPSAVVNHRTPATHKYGDGPRYASVKGIMAAKRKELKEISLADLGVSLSPRVRYTTVAAPPARKAGIKVADVPELLKRLHEEAKAL
ncbi:MAG: electron transfer flavoprotein subunit beta/FixA family protein [Pseudomonadota bacterium]